MVTPDSSESARYSFEKYRPLHETRREAEKAQQDAQTLLVRLGQKPPQGGVQAHPLFPKLKEYCAEVTVNIEWYEERRKQAKEDWKNLFFAVIAGGGLTAALAIFLAEKVQTEVAITIFLAAFLPALQGLSSAIDHKSRMGGFWKASADLKELLFRLEEAWRGKDLEKEKVTYHVEGHDVERTFEEVLKLDRSAARQVCRAERESFFNTFKSPAEVVSKFSESIASIRKPEPPAAKKPEGTQAPAATAQAPQPARPAELATNVKSAAEGLSQLMKEIEDPDKRAVALAEAVKLLQGLSKELDKSGPN